MEFVDWIPALTTTGLTATLFGVAAWLARNLIATRLTKSVEFEFNKKLEELRAEQRKAEERLKAELRAKEAQIDALQSGALAAMLSRRQALDQRRLKAAEEIWEAVKALGPARHVATLMSMVKYDAASARAERDPKFREFIGVVGQGFDAKTLDLSTAHRARPFVTPVVWAAFSAYSAVCMHGALRNLALKAGLADGEVSDLDAVNKLVVVALPHYKDFLKEHGSMAYIHAIPALEEKLLAEIQAMLKGVEGDVDAIARASTITQLAAQVAQADATRSAS